MLLVDAHNDIASVLFQKKESLYQNTGHTDLKRLDDFSFQTILCAAVFVHPRVGRKAYQKAMQILHYFQHEIKKFHTHVGVLDLSKKVCVVPALEGTHVLGGQVQSLHDFYQKGVRVVSLTWNPSNDFAGGCEDAKRGLTKRGRKLLKEMDRRQMILDLSHSSDRTFDEAMEVYQGDVIASHSNARALCQHPRNLTDYQIQRIHQRKGVIGINLYPPFVSGEKCSVKDVINHIEYIAGIAGIETVGFGFDFDGVDILPEGIFGIQDIDQIINTLLKYNYSEMSIQRIVGKNFEKVFEKVISSNRHAKS